MKSLDSFFQSDLVNALGWTIIHSLWQGLLIVFILTLGLVVLRMHSSRIRYMLGYFALVGMMLCSIGTFSWYLTNQTASTISDTSQMHDAGTTIGPAESTLAITPTQVGTLESSWELFFGFLEQNLALIAIAWLIGVLMLSLRFLAELAYLQRLRYQPGQPIITKYQDMLQKLSKQMGISKLVDLKENIRIGSPMVIGFVKPVILLPFGLLSGLEPSQVESILAHELAHIRRNDYILNLLQSLVEIVLFFNPAIWWVSSFIRSEREHCCDEMAIEATGNEMVFVQTLAKLETYRQQPNQLALAFTGRRDGGLLGRVKRIVNREEQMQLPYKLFWSSLILLTSLSLFAFQSQPLNAQVQEEKVPLVAIDSVELNLEFPTAATIDLSKELVDLNTIVSPKVITNLKPSKTSEKPQAQRTVKDSVPAVQAKGLSELKPSKVVFNDSIPAIIKKLELQLEELRRFYEEKELALEKQNLDLRKAIMDLRRQSLKMENEQLKMRYELEKKGQEVKLKNKEHLQELAMMENALNKEAVQLEYERKKLSEKMVTEGQSEELVKVLNELQDRFRDIERKRSEIGFSQQQNQLSAELEVQQLEHHQWQLQKEAEIEAGEVRLKNLELEQVIEELVIKLQKIQAEKQEKLGTLKLQLLKETERWKASKMREGKN